MRSKSREIRLQIVRIKRAAARRARAHSLFARRVRGRSRRRSKRLRPFAASDMRSRRGLIEILSAEKKWSEVAAALRSRSFARRRRNRATRTPTIFPSRSRFIVQEISTHRAKRLRRRSLRAPTTRGTAAPSEARSHRREVGAPERSSISRRKGSTRSRRSRSSAITAARRRASSICDFFGITAEQIEIARAIKFPDGGTPVYRMRNYLEQAGFTARRIEAAITGSPRAHRSRYSGDPRRGLLGLASRCSGHRLRRRAREFWRFKIR